MSQENVEIVRRGFDVWNSGDMGAYRELLDPDFVLRPPQIWPEPGPFVGREAALREFEQARSTWSTDGAEPISDFVDLGDRVVVRLAWRTQGQGPAATIEMTSVYMVRNGRMVSMDFFFDHAQALRAARLADLASKAGHCGRPYDQRDRLGELCAETAPAHLDAAPRDDRPEDER